MRLRLIPGTSRSNSAYRAVPTLANPSGDAVAVAAALREVGFQIVNLKTDLGKEPLVTALRDFSRADPAVKVSVSASRPSFGKSVASDAMIALPIAV